MCTPAWDIITLFFFWSGDIITLETISFRHDGPVLFRIEQASNAWNYITKHSKYEQNTMLDEEAQWTIVWNFQLKFIANNNWPTTRLSLSLTIPIFVSRWETSSLELEVVMISLLKTWNKLHAFSLWLLI